MSAQIKSPPSPSAHSHAAGIQLPEVFFPKGAIAFFIGLLIFFGVVWLTLYFLMIYRQGSL